MRKHWMKWGTLLAILVALSAPALAHEGDDDRNQGGAQDARRHGYQQGYRDGYDHGRHDLERRAGYDYRSNDWKDGKRGYEKYMGSKGQFKQGYKEGYQRGYDDGYRRRVSRGGDIYGRSGPRISGRNNDDYWGRRRDDRNGDRGWGDQDAAYNTGYSDGVTYGRNDRQNQRGYHVEKNVMYLMGLHGYDDRYGNKDDYKRRYREAFTRGYQVGYGR